MEVDLLVRCFHYTRSLAHIHPVLSPTASILLLVT